MYRLFGLTNMLLITTNTSTHLLHFSPTLNCHLNLPAWWSMLKQLGRQKAILLYYGIWTKHACGSDSIDIVCGQIRPISQNTNTQCFPNNNNNNQQQSDSIYLIWFWLDAGVWLEIVNYTQSTALTTPSPPSPVPLTNSQYTMYPTISNMNLNITHCYLNLV